MAASIIVRLRLFAVVAGALVIANLPQQAHGSPALVAALTADPTTAGQWAPLQSWPLVAVHSALLNTGSVLVWDAWELGGTPSARLWNPATGAFTSVPSGEQLFCSAHVQLADGRLLVIGGHNGSEFGSSQASIFDPSSSTWSKAPSMSYPRWYPSANELGDGRVVTISGQTTPGHFADIPEIYDPQANSWSQISSVNTTIPYDFYPLSHLLPNGKVAVLDISVNGSINYLDAGAGTWTPGPTAPFLYGSAVMYRPGKLLLSGGGSPYGSGTPAQTSSAVIDLTASTPTWTTTAPMANPRFQHNLVTLADGSVMAIGGAQTVDIGAMSGSLPSEIWDPATQTWTTVASLQNPRMYHSTATLLPDGRVLVAGGGRLSPAPDYLTSEIYSPPYLFKGARPTISSAPGSALYGGTMSVQTPDSASIASVALIGLGSVTHTSNMAQPYVPLSFTSGSGALNVQVPANSNLAPPGYYMLTVTNSVGVPSVSMMVRIGGPDKTPPAVASVVPAAGATGASFSSPLTATFTKSVVASSISFGLADASNTAVPGSVTYDDSSRTATFTPASALAQGAIYKATVSGATDQAGNAMTSPYSWSFSTSSCPCNMLGSGTPAVAAVNDPGAVEVGVKFKSDTSGYINGIRFYKGSTNTGTHVGSLWSSSGTPLASATFSGETASGWQQVLFASPVAVTANTTYVASYHTNAGSYSATGAGFTNSVDSPPLHGLSSGSSGGNGLYQYSGSSVFPTQSYNATNYWVDVVFNTTPSGTAPTVIGTSPASNAGSAAFTGNLTAKFSKSVTTASISFGMRDPSNNAVAGAVTYDDPSRTASFSPAAPLAQGTKYTATVSGATDQGGVAMTGPYSWSFTTLSCPCTILGNATPAAAATNDSGSIELGVKFTSDVGGYLTGIRFYKGVSNTGTHVGSLWSNAGTLLASATFASETSNGWQQVLFSTPVAVTANTTYVASYHTNSGNYSATGGFFAGDVDNRPLHAPATGTGGGNGLYQYGASSVFPTQTFNANNYWVDAVFNTTPVDSSAPAVISTVPAASGTNAPFTGGVTATFSKPVVASSITFGLVDSASRAVAGSAGYDTSTNTASFTPGAPLAQGAKYTATVSGATDSAGHTMAAPYSWSFTTLSCPCNMLGNATPAQVAANDSGAIEVGVKFKADVSGYINGLRFFKANSNTGTHVGNLWSSSGTLLATATFSSETASGWQQVGFPAPVAVTANTTYVASYHTNTGSYSANGGYFANSADRAPLHGLASGSSGGNGVYQYSPNSAFPTASFNSTNYWVDVVFNTNDTVPPTVTSQSPAPNATGVSASTVSVTFSKPVIASSISLGLRDPNNVAVAGSVAYNDASRTATFTASSSLALGTTYTATVSGATDQSGNVMTASSWSFTTLSCPCNMFGNATPAVAAVNDPSAIELGVKFKSDVNGFIYGIRFYKGSANTGTHVGNLWSSSGTLLATATFAGETASGWQQVNFSAPVAVTAGTTYVASYHTNAGNYAYSGAFFNTGADSGPLHAPASGASGGNGVFMYGPGSAFPTQSYNASNYWVDVTFNVR